MDVGYYALLSQVFGVHVAANHCMITGQTARVNDVSANVHKADDRTDRDNFRSLHAKTFSTPDLFEFQPHHGDEV